ncbi:MAG TPA: DUF4954 family protein [Marinilabiliaceae bacterium]|nr:DUF4954 family protein [Marinilabiliaceae bacterium]
MKYRNLNLPEIQQLENNLCFCRDWSKVKVKEGFVAENIRNVVFSGDNYIGLLKKEFVSLGGVPKFSGIQNATIHNCIIDDDVYINQVKNHLANYHIQRDVVIENVDSLIVTQKTTFGNGVRVAVLNEVGGREIAIYNELSAHTAYLMAFYRHRPELINHLLNMVDSYAEALSSTMGTISEGAHIINCRTIENVNVGSYAEIDGIYRLINGTIISCKRDPSYVGAGVIAENFIFLDGSYVSESAMIFSSFVGQGCVLGKQYSAENSVFFANCQGYHGEACSIFAGPYTVSHHKSSLLIAGYYSFLNAGSGSNQSNHMYKLGPIHQGVVERGSKTTSDSYLLWPAKVGAFSLVMGRHFRNADTSDLPYSYLIENSDESYLVPGINLRSIGTIRDARKWPHRDRRKGDRQLDQIVFNLLSPYSVQKIIKGIEVLNQLKSSDQKINDYYNYNGVRIEERALIRGVELYKLGLVKFLGNGLLKKLEVGSFSTVEEMRQILSSSELNGDEGWVDMAGLIVPKEIVNQMVTDIESGKISNLGRMNDMFSQWKAQYFDWVWNWTVARLKSEKYMDLQVATVSEIKEFVKKWASAVIGLDEMMYEDARKEFTLKSQTGFGIDGSNDTKALDFEHVRGGFSSHPDVMGILEHIEKKSALAKFVLSKLDTIE